MVENSSKTRISKDSIERGIHRTGQYQYDQTTKTQPVSSVQIISSKNKFTLNEKLDGLHLF